MALENLAIKLAEVQESVTKMSEAIKQKDDLSVVKIMDKPGVLKDYVSEYYTDLEDMLEPKLVSYLEQKYPFFVVSKHEKGLACKIGNWHRSEPLALVEVGNLEVNQFGNKIDTLLEFEKNPDMFMRVFDIQKEKQNLMEEYNKQSYALQKELSDISHQHTSLLNEVPEKRGLFGKTDTTREDKIMWYENKEAELTRKMDDYNAEYQAQLRQLNMELDGQEQDAHKIHLKQIVVENEFQAVVQVFGTVEKFVGSLTSLKEDYIAYLEGGKA